MRQALILAVLLLFTAPAAWGATFDFSEWVPTSSATSVSVSSTAVGITACGSGLTETPALVQVQTNGIYFVVNSATATPVATDFVAVASDVIFLRKPSLFRAIRQAADATLKVQCVAR